MANNGNVLRGPWTAHRTAEQQEKADRRRVSYACANGHTTDVALGAAGSAPATWACRHCGGPATVDTSPYTPNEPPTP